MWVHIPLRGHGWSPAIATLWLWWHHRLRLCRLDVGRAHLRCGERLSVLLRVKASGWLKRRCTHVRRLERRLRARWRAIPPSICGLWRGVWLSALRGELLVGGGHLMRTDQLEYTGPNRELIPNVHPVSTLHTLMVHKRAVRAVQILNDDLLVEGHDLGVLA